MSIQSEITRISGNVADALTAIANKGVSIPAGSNSDDLATLIGMIQQGGGQGMVVVETQDSHGGTIVTITGEEVKLQAKGPITPTTSSQLIEPDEGYTGLSQVSISAMPSGTAGTPTASKGAVSNHSVSVTPSVTNTTGYIAGGTKTGTAVSVSASELVSGTYTVDSSGIKDVTNYASASVPAMTLPSSASSSHTGTSKATISRSTSAQYINIPTGYNNTAQYYTVSATPNGTEGTPTATKGTVSNHSVSVTPSVTNSAGYISGGTKTGTAVTVAASDLVSGSETKSSNGTYDVTNLSSLVVAVPIVHYYTGSSTPSSSLGANGDIYLQTS